MVAIEMTETASIERIARRSKRKVAEKPAENGTSSAASTAKKPRSNDQKRKESARKKEKLAPEAPKDEVVDLAAGDEIEDDEGIGEEEEIEDEAEENVLEKGKDSGVTKRKGVAARNANKNPDGEEIDESFVGDPVPEQEAQERWPHRYQRKVASTKKNRVDDDDVIKASRHYLQARVDDNIYELNDNVYVQAGEGEANFIGRIIEFFETCDNQLYFTAQWFYRAEDTVIKKLAHFSNAEEVDYYHDPRRVFLSDDTNDNALNCIVSKVNIVRVASNIDLPAKAKGIPSCDLYYDMSYSGDYSTFASLPSDKSDMSNQKRELSLLDLYSGCGAMSTGLCLGANLSGVNLQTRWAVDLNRYACESLKFNHPEAEVRNEKAEDFLAVLREWEKLCKRYGFGDGNILPSDINSSDDEEEEELTGVTSEEFEVGKIVGICYGKTPNLEKNGLKFKVRWKGYGPSDDTWEPIDGLSNCQERIQAFVRHGYKNNILPLPGTVDVICGGPPCQGISGFNRFRNKEDPLKDEKNQQMVVYMEIIEFLKPKFVLMENVVDILKFAQGFLGRYALSRLVAMNYQARLGIMAAGCYGLPQFRMRVFLWGALPSQKLPQFPLPTHDVVIRGGGPVEFERNLVAYGEGQERHLEKKLLLRDAISDLPPVGNDESRDEITYQEPPQTDFQRYIRLTLEELMHPSSTEGKQYPSGSLFDHRPLRLNEDDYGRVCRIPTNKGANFRDLPGVMVGPDNVVQWDPIIDRVLLPSGKPLVPDYAMSFIKGKSMKPFGRLWWDETVPTVVTRAEPHNQIILHPLQHRVLTIRENARLQGFPDYYRLFGPVKERYIQVGNAVAVPVSRALGYALGQAYQGEENEQHVLTLPKNFPNKI